MARPKRRTVESSGAYLGVAGGGPSLAGRPMKPCRACHQPIDAKAFKCQHCRSFQRFGYLFEYGQIAIGVLIGLAAILTGIRQGFLWVSPLATEQVAAIIAALSDSEPTDAHRPQALQAHTFKLQDPSRSVTEPQKMWLHLVNIDERDVVLLGGKSGYYRARCRNGQEPRQWWGSVSVGNSEARTYEVPGSADTSDQNRVALPFPGTTIPLLLETQESIPGDWIGADVTVVLICTIEGQRADQTLSFTVFGGASP